MKIWNSPLRTSSTSSVTSDRMDERIVIAQESGERIDALLAHMVEGLSRSAIQKLIEDGHVLLDKRPVKKNYKCTSGDRFTLILPEAADIPLLPQDLPLEIAYEDDDLIVVNKERGMVVHPAAGHYSGTLVNALMAHCGDSYSAVRYSCAFVCRVYSNMAE